MRIRLARYTDRNTITDFFRGLLTEREEKKINNTFQAMKHPGRRCFETHILVLEQNNIIIGAIAFDARKIYAIYIEMNNRKNGHGKSLMSAAALYAKACGNCELELLATQASVEFYKKLGFRGEAVDAMRFGAAELTLNNTQFEFDALCQILNNNSALQVDVDFRKILQAVKSESYISRIDVGPQMTAEIYAEYRKELAPPQEHREDEPLVQTDNSRCCAPRCVLL